VLLVACDQKCGANESIRECVQLHQRLVQRGHFFFGDSCRLTVYRPLFAFFRVKLGSKDPA